MARDLNETLRRYVRPENDNMMQDALQTRGILAVCATLALI